MTWKLRPPTVRRAGAALALLGGPALPPGAQAATVSPDTEPEAAATGGAPARDLGREVLADNDGWAAEGTGTTGGSAADEDHVLTVRNRAQLVAALDGGSSVPEIIRVAGPIDANTDDRGRRLDRAGYATGGYDLAAYDPRTWGGAKPSGPQEDARKAGAGRAA